MNAIIPEMTISNSLFKYSNRSTPQTKSPSLLEAPIIT